MLQYATKRIWILLVVAVLLLAVGYWAVSPHVVSRPVAADGEKIDLLGSGWNYVPGVSTKADGLHVAYLGRAIAQQDGAVGQANSAVNLYGTHLHIGNTFTLNATVKDIKGSASLRLYSSPPVVQDEFRVEPTGLELTFTSKSVTTEVWGGYKNQRLYAQVPASTQTANLTLLPSNAVTVQYQGKTTNVSVNGQLVAKLATNQIFANDVWFGLSAVHPGESWVLSDMSSTANSKVSVQNSQTAPNYPKSNQGLQTLASSKRPGFIVGAAMALGPAVADSQYATLAFGGNFGQLTTENALKWQFIEPRSNVFDFSEADALVALAAKNGLAVHGHTLVFGEANPKWVQDLPTSTAADKQHVKQVMLNHITRTVSHFKGKIKSWDVVNEPLADFDAPTAHDGLRQHLWYKAMGASYIAAAFTAAHQADPAAKLYLNDFGLEEDGDRWNTLLALVTQLKSQGVPIDGVGFEAHVYQAGDEINPAVLRSHIQTLARLGLTVRISEMDVYDDSGTAVQATQYADVFNACLAESNCVSWSTWGITDRYDMWQDDANHMQYGQDLLWDAQAHPTAAYSKIQQSIAQ